LPHTTKLLYQGRVLQLGLDSLTLPNGKPLELEVVRHPGGAAIVALDRQDQVCLLRQYRHAGGGWLWELPAGRLEAHEQPRTTAARELVEEAGLQASRWDSLGEILVSPGYSDEIIYLYLARDLTVVPAQPEEHELIEIHWIAFDQALQQIHDGTIIDAKTMLGLTLARDFIKE
jgi:8-oxo-dGTP pyrophosphatase MutT (NUDIX family)